MYKQLQQSQVENMVLISKVKPRLNQISPQCIVIRYNGKYQVTQCAGCFFRGATSKINERAIDYSCIDEDFHLLKHSVEKRNKTLGVNSCNIILNKII